MKYKLVSLLVCILLIAALAVPVSATSPLVMDVANLMTNTEAAALTEQSQKIQNTYGLDVVILTVPNLMGKSAQAFADDYYDNNRYREDGVLFLLDMGSRQWHISTSGAAITLLSDQDLMDIEEQVIPSFSDGRFYHAFNRFLTILPKYLDNESGFGINLMVSLLIGAAVAGIAVLIMRGTMNTKKAQRSAVSYEVENSYHLRAHQDLFLYSNISKRAKPKENSSGSSTHRSSSGRSHGGRGGRF